MTTRKKTGNGRPTWEASGKEEKNSTIRPRPGDRTHLTVREVEQLLQAAKGGRNEARDRCLLLLFRHDLRVSEACRMKLDQIDPDSPRAPRRPAEARAIDGPSVASKREAMAVSTGTTSIPLRKGFHSLHLTSSCEVAAQFIGFVKEAAQ